MKNLFLSLLAPSLLALILLAGCVEESNNIVTFDEVLESATFNNRLLAPVIIYRDGVAKDTIPARGTWVEPLGVKGPVNFAWKLVRPNDRYGNPVGLEPYVKLPVQYAINGKYDITNELPGDGSIFSGRTMFTPMVGNFSSKPYRLIVNYEEDDQVITNYLIPHSIDSLLAYAPYFYWNSNSNIRLESTVDNYYYMFTRDDTTQQKLELDESSEFSGSGRTVPVSIY
jgi:hypothetical protein